MRLALGSLDPLVELVEESGGLLPVRAAACRLFAATRASDEVARSLLLPLVEADSRLEWRGSHVALAGAPPRRLADTSFVVFDLETTGLAAASARICEIGAVRIERLELVDTFQTLVAPEGVMSRSSRRITGLTDAALAGAPRIGRALPRFCAFAGSAVLVAHNARFDVGFLDHELERRSGDRLAATVIDTVPLARNLLRGRVERTNLAALAAFFGVSVEPCHRALPDAQATAEVFLRLVELALEDGAATLEELEALAAPRPKRIHGKRHLAREAPALPGVYLFRDPGGQVLYVGKARNLRGRLRSYFQSREQRPAVEDALDRLSHIEWRVTGSELEASLEEIRLIRELRPPANSRTPRPESYVYLHRRGERVVLSRLPSPFGPLRHRAQAKRAAEALRGCSAYEFENLLEGEPLERLRHELALLSEWGHELEIRRQRRRLVSLEAVIRAIRRAQELLALELCVFVPSLEPGRRDVFVVCAGRVERRGAHDAELSLGELRQALAGSRRPAPAAVGPDDLDALLATASFLKAEGSDAIVIPLDTLAV